MEEDIGTLLNKKREEQQAAILELARINLELARLIVQKSEYVFS